MTIASAPNVPSTGSGSGVTVATEFPTPGDPYTDRVCRTDIDGLIFFHDGTRWLSEQMFSVQFSTHGYTGASGDFNEVHRSAIPDDYDLFFERIDAFTRTSTTSNGSNYWTVYLSEYDGSYNTLKSWVTSGDTADAWTDHDDAATNTLVTGARFLAATATKTAGSPGALSAHLTAKYRIVGP